MIALSQERWRGIVLGAFGVLLFLGLWQLIGVNRWAGLTWPPLTDVLTFLFNPSRRALFGRAMSASFSMIALGYVTGAAIGIVLAGIAHLVHPLRPGLDRLASVVHAIPAIALAPLFIVMLSREMTGMAIAALNVFFVIYVATTSGLVASTAAHRDLFQVFGASPVKRLMRLDLPAALPAIVSGLKYAVPAAFIGAILGEWFGSSRGLGLLMVSAMQNFQIPLLWSAVLIASTASLLVFAAMSVVEHLVYRRYR
ncbi:NitT/TauT family transport system permease protein [Faunimonas pinastri]|uniref:NitT/TauT family transport system permease protein n=1 Tax=Faunimonas pinastri TaxID=1855383 RepID=A0A1H9B1X1_9HYPH|nr:ABC transporter permease subunit [Faunimonas pinastri]SEP82825.1 NitT/TauT family transport system permease protein [Faunimonas pinastri]